MEGDSTAGMCPTTSSESTQLATDDEPVCLATLPDELVLAVATALSLLAPRTSMKEMLEEEERRLRDGAPRTLLSLAEPKPARPRPTRPGNLLALAHSCRPFRTLLLADDALWESLASRELGPLAPALARRAHAHAAAQPPPLAGVALYRRALALQHMLPDLM